MTQSILKINTSGRKNGSVTRELVDAILARIETARPGASVVERDVSSGLPILTENWIGANFTPVDQRTPEQIATLSLSDELVAELRAADTVVIGLPVYNFSTPAAFKLWVDQIARVGETFTYTETGPKGLLEGKRVILAIASGGVETGSAADFASTYAKFILGFVGITDVSVVSANGGAMDPEAALAAANTQIAALDIAA